ncbi:hypothetical protein SBRCBS47491_005620 [Sporothrix bragantina]|uniref:Uncharacterized protein n=1 Tax=Sporothrix bragantina TaxID=671064 RepID=A0ABP0C0A2_9PEZI
MAVVAFGPGDSWFVESPSQWKWGTLPAPCLGFFHSTAPSKVDHVHNLVLGANGSFMMTWRGKDGSSYQCNSGLPPDLAAWLDKKDASGRLARNVTNIRLAIGPDNASFFVTDGIDYYWSNLPVGLNNAIKSLLRPGGGFTSAPRLVALGVQGNYMMITAGHGGSWSVAAYPELDTFLDEQRIKHSHTPGMFSNVATVALDAFDVRNFVLTYYDGGHYGWIPDELDDLVWPVLRTLPKSAPGRASATVVTTTTTTAAAPGRPPAQHHNSSTFSNVLKLANVALKANANIVGGGSGGGGVDIGGGGLDFSGVTDAFTSTLQSQTWGSVSDVAANWIIQ